MRIALDVFQCLHTGYAGCERCSADKGEATYYASREEISVIDNTFLS